MSNSDPLNDAIQEFNGSKIQPIDEKALSPAEPPYSIFTYSEKWMIVTIASTAAIFSPLSANIYFPAIPTIAHAFRKSTELINLTVTTNMVVQGISPMFWAPLADRNGRRPVALGCIFTLILACIGLALIPTNAYWALMLLRCLQSAGSASTIAVGAGVVGDVADRAERGGFMSVFNLGPMFGPCIGPVIGGVLSQHLGWRSIFWFLAIASAVCFIFILLFLPETLRAIVGNGSIPPPKLYTPLIPLLGRSIQNGASSDIERPPRRSFQNPFTLFKYPDVVILLVLNGFCVAVLFGVTASTSSLFQQIYPFLNETDIGLCFLAMGGGMVLSTLISGRVLDWEYRRVKDNLIKNLAITNANRSENLKLEDVTKDENFPIEYARLRFLPGYVAIFVASTIGYGWSLQSWVSLAVPLILQAIVGYCMFSINNCTQTLTIDLVPDRSSSVTACSNIIRSTMGAVLVSIVQIIINAIGIGWTYTLFGCLCMLCFPMHLAVVRWGPLWRAKRRERQRVVT